MNSSADFGLAADKVHQCKFFDWKSSQNLDTFKVWSVLKYTFHWVNVTLYLHFKLRWLAISKPVEVEKSSIPEKRAQNSGKWKKF